MYWSVQMGAVKQGSVQMAELILLEELARCPQGDCHLSTYTHKYEENQRLPNVCKYGINLQFGLAYVNNITHNLTECLMNEAHCLYKSLTAS